MAMKYLVLCYFLTKLKGKAIPCSEQYPISVAYLPEVCYISASANADTAPGSLWFRRADTYPARSRMFYGTRFLRDIFSFLPPAGFHQAQRVTHCFPEGKI
jgi:hypothetical protein